MEFIQNSVRTRPVVVEIDSSGSPGEVQGVLGRFRESWGSSRGPGEVQGDLALGLGLD